MLLSRRGTQPMLLLSPGSCSCVWAVRESFSHVHMLGAPSSVQEEADAAGSSCPPVLALLCPGHVAPKPHGKQKSNSACAAELHWCEPHVNSREGPSGDDLRPFPVPTMQEDAPEAAALTSRSLCTGEGGRAARAAAQAPGGGTPAARRSHPRAARADRAATAATSRPRDQLRACRVCAAAAPSSCAPQRRGRGAEGASCAALIAAGASRRCC